MRTVAVYISTLLLSALLWSCEFDETLGYLVPNELEPFVQEFIVQGNVHGRDVSFIRSRLTIFYEEGLKQKGALGYCDVRGQQIVIKLDREYSEFILEYHPGRMYTLLFHELGHGALHKGTCKLEKYNESGVGSA